MSINKIVIVLNELSMTKALLQRAFSFASEKGTVVEILYVHERPMFDVPNFFQLKKNKTDDTLDKEKVKQSIKNTIATIENSKECAIFIFVNDTVNRVLALIKDDKQTLIITPYHQKITQNLVKKIPLPILTIKNEYSKYKNILLYLNANSRSDECVLQTKTLFLHSNIRLLYDYRYVVDPSIDIDLQNIQEIEKMQRESFEKLKKQSALDGDFFVDSSFFEDSLVKYLQKEEYDLIVICSHEGDFIISDSITLELLHELSTDLLIT